MRSDYRRLFVLCAATTWILAPSTASAQTEDVVWRGAVGVTVSGNDLSKSGAAGWGNFGASSLQTLESNGFVEFSINGVAMAGLSMGDTNQSYGDIDFAIYVTGTTLYVYEGGYQYGPTGTVSPSDKLRVEVSGSVVRYKKNGVVFYTSTAAARFPLLVDSSLYSTGPTLNDARIGQTSFSGDAGVTVSEGTLTKTGSAGWNAGAVSARRIPWGDGYVEFSALETNKARAAGLSYGDTDKTLADIDFAIVLKANATVEVQEGGVSRGTFNAYTTGDRFRVEVQDGIVTYLQNGVLFYTSAVAPTFPLWADTSLNETGATLSDLVVSEIVWTTANGVTRVAGTLSKTGSAGWNAGAASTASLASDGFVEFTASETNTTRICGLADQDTSYNPAEIDFGIQLQSNGDVRVYESGTLRGTFGTYASGDRFRVEIQFGVPAYRKNGVVFYTSGVAPTYPLSVDAALDTPGATLREVRLGNLAWRNEVGVSVWGYGLKNTAATGYGNSGAVSTSELTSGDGWVEFTVTDRYAGRALGLSNGDTDRNYTDIDFGFEAHSNGLVYVVQKGTYISSYGASVIGDRLRIAVEGGVVKYRRNGTLLYTSSQPIVYPLLIDTALQTNGTAITDILRSSNFTQTPIYVSAPTFAPGSGTFNVAQNVTVSCLTPGTQVHYTTNGQDPTQSDSSVACGGTIAVGQSLTLKARGWRTGWGPSSVTAAVYTLVVGTPSLSPPPTSYVGAQTVTLSTVTPGATMRYTTNGIDPTPADTVGTSVSVDRTMILKARATKAGWTDSAVAGGTYVVTVGTVATPSLSPPPGSYPGTQNVTISCATSGATIRYTRDGTNPTFSSPIYTGPLPVAWAQTIKARAYKIDWLASAVAGGTYTIGSGVSGAAMISPPSGRYSGGLGAVITSTTGGSIIRYTTNGVDPTESDPVIGSGGMVSVGQSAGVKVRTWTPGLQPSVVVRADYEIVGAVAAGSRHGMALTANGPVSTWGRNDSGQLGDGTTTLRLSPVGVSGGLDDVIAVAAGYMHSVALKSDGTVWSWGYNSADGVLGAGITEAQRTAPVQVVTASGPLTGIVAIAAGQKHTIALKSDSTVWVWGFGYYGALGLGNTNSQTRAVQVPGLAGVTQIAAGGWSSFALQTGGATVGNVWAWGLNDSGQLLDGTTTIRYSPVLTPAQATLVAAGVRHTFIRKPDGTIWGAGLNDYGQLGIGNTTTPQMTLVPALGGLTGVIKISASGAHTLALTSAGEVWGVGFNGFGPLGDGTTVSKSTPTQTVLLEDTVDIAASNFAHDIYNPANEFSVALTGDGRVWTWGNNAYNGLGNGLTTNDHRFRPQPIENFSIADQSWLTGDPDGDDLLTRDEIALGTDPFKADTNGDGISDSVAVSSGVSPTATDIDGDGMTNSAERALGLDPHRADTDGDGVSDGVDCFAWDPTRSTCPQPQPGDVTPPLINLFEPVGAVLLSSLP